jgi:hypothetical protein
VCFQLQIDPPVLLQNCYLFLFIAAEIWQIYISAERNAMHDGVGLERELNK